MIALARGTCATEDGKNAMDDYSCARHTNTQQRNRAQRRCMWAWLWRESDVQNITDATLCLVALARDTRADNTMTVTTLLMIAVNRRSRGSNTEQDSDNSCTHGTDKTPRRQVKTYIWGPGNDFQSPKSSLGDPAMAAKHTITFGLRSKMATTRKCDSVAPEILHCTELCLYYY